MSEQVLCRWATRWDREDLVTHVAELMRLHEREEDGDALREAFEYALRHPERVRFAVAQRDEKIIAVVSLHDCYSTWAGRPYGCIQDVIVAEEERGSGVAQQLFEFVLTEAWRRKYCRVDLEVLETNERAKSFYTKMGMKWSGCLTYTMSLTEDEPREA